MSKEVRWTKIILEEFIDKACLTKTEEIIMRTRVAGYTRTEQAEAFGMSLSTVDRTIARLKEKYDDVQKTSLILPKRKHSVQEDYLDE